MDRAANRARQSFDGRDLYPTLEEKVAALAESVIRSHPFVDANKRTGMAAAMVMFERNGQTVIAEADDMYDLAFQVEAGHVTVQDLAEWFADPINVLPLTEDEAEVMERLLDLDPFNRWEEEE